MDSEINKPVALVTGANKGIGKETARQLAQCGMTVLIGSRDLDRSDAAARELQAERLAVTSLPLDVTDATSAENATDILRRDHGRLDVLINNAGVFVARPSLSTTALKRLESADVRFTEGADHGRL